MVLDFSIHPNIWQLRGQISPSARELQHWSWFPFIAHHFISENHQKNLWALPYFCLGCLLQSAPLTSCSQPHLSRNSCSGRSLNQINLYFLALYTRWLMKKGKKCEKLSRLFVGMENFTFREMQVAKYRWENRSVSFFCRLFLWRFAKIRK